MRYCLVVIVKINKFTIEEFYFEVSYSHFHFQQELFSTALNGISYLFRLSNSIKPIHTKLYIEYKETLPYFYIANQVSESNTRNFQFNINSNIWQSVFTVTNPIFFRTRWVKFSR